MKMINVLVGVLLAFGVSLAVASGGKVKEQSPLYDENGDVVGIVVPVEGCLVSPVDQSGKYLYIVCPYDVED